MVKWRIALFVSGQGSNAIKLMEHFQGHDRIGVAALVSNNSNSLAIDKATELSVPVHILSNKTLEEGREVRTILSASSIDYIVLAGFLRKLPAELIQAYDQRILNIHPSLLPKYGGKGMYGDHVHEAVLANGEQETGITIHVVNEEFDKGQRVAQFFAAISTLETLEGIRNEVRKLEHRYFAPVIEQYILNSN